MKDCAIRTFHNKVKSAILKGCKCFSESEEGTLLYMDKECELRAARVKGPDGDLRPYKGFPREETIHFSQLSGGDFLAAVCFREGLKMWLMPYRKVEFKRHHKGLYQADISLFDLEYNGKEIKCK